MMVRGENNKEMSQFNKRIIIFKVFTILCLLYTYFLGVFNYIGLTIFGATSSFTIVQILMYTLQKRDRLRDKLNE